MLPATGRTGIQSPSAMGRFALPSSLVAASNRHEVVQPPEVINCYSESQFVSQAAHMLMLKIKETIYTEEEDSQGSWTGKYAIIGLSGAITSRLVLQACAGRMKSELASRLDWSKVIIFVVDDRYVPLNDPASNSGMIQEVFINESPIPAKNFIYPNTSLPLAECISDYDRRLGEVFQFSRPTLVTLGLGPDGHLASWFPPLNAEAAFQAFDPFHYVCHTTTDTFEVRDRITVSMHLILSAKCKFMLFRSAEKGEAYKSVLAKVHKKDAIREEPLLQLLKSQSVHVICYPPLEHDEITELHTTWTESGQSLSVVLLGASGDLACKKTFPALFSLYTSGHIPADFHIAGYARSQLDVERLWQKIEPKLRSILDGFAIAEDREIKEKLEGFKKHISFHHCAAYDDDKSARAMGEWLSSNFESKYKKANRIFYLALPPDAFAGAVGALKRNCWSGKGGWSRVVVEKPFGKDSESSEALSCELAKYAREEELFRIDHYLGKEMVLNLFVLRFANLFLSPVWHRHYVKCVRITFKETTGTEGRGGYFDNYGIIRDVIQNHLLQIVSLVAMERPASLLDEDIRDEKVKVLKCIKPCKLERTLLGQFTASSEVPGYKEDPTVPADSKCPTFCLTSLYIDNERWQGVPFILKAGKALETQVAEIRIQFQPVLSGFFAGSLPQNELVLRIQPNEAIYLKCLGKRPGLCQDLVETELDLTVMERLNVARVNDAYERLLLDVIKGEKNNFVRSDELREAWRILTPLLHEIEQKKVEPEPYVAGSHGPASAYKLIKELGYEYHDGYVWSGRSE